MFESQSSYFCRKKGTHSGKKKRIKNRKGEEFRGSLGGGKGGSISPFPDSVTSLNKVGEKRDIKRGNRGI